MLAGPIHPPLDRVFVHPGDPGRRPNAALFDDDRQRIQDLLSFRTQPIEKGPFGLRKGLATGAAQVVNGALRATIGVAFQLTLFYLTEKRALGGGTIQIVGEGLPFHGRILREKRRGLPLNYELKTTESIGTLPGKKIHLNPEKSLPADDNPFADGSTHLFSADRTQYILISNTASLYSMVMFGKGITDGGQFLDRITN